MGLLPCKSCYKWSQGEVSASTKPTLPEMSQLHSAESYVLQAASEAEGILIMTFCGTQ